MATKSDFIFRYGVRNWAEYNRALVRRGSLIFWIDEQAVRGWRDSGATGPRGGRPRVYADTSIECTLMVKAVFHLSLRATQGFLESVVQLMGVELPVPDYTTAYGPNTRPIALRRFSVVVVQDPADALAARYGACPWRIRSYAAIGRVTRPLQ